MANSLAFYCEYSANITKKCYRWDYIHENIGKMIKNGIIMQMSHLSNVRIKGIANEQEFVSSVLYVFLSQY